MKIGKTELARLVISAKNCTIQFRRKDGKKRVIPCSIKGQDPLGYILVTEHLSNQMKKIDPKNIISAEIEGKIYKC